MSQPITTASALRRSRLTALGGVALLLLTLSTSACWGGGKDGKEELSLSLPARWESVSPLAPDAAVELRADGTGTAENLPVPSGEPCSVRDAQKYSGSFEWKAQGPGVLQMILPGARVRAGADLQFGSADWGKLVVQVCGAASGPEGILALFGGP